MIKSITFSEAFINKPGFGQSFCFKGRLYEYIDTVYAADDVLIVCSYVNSKGELVYRALSQKKYCNNTVCFL